MNTKMKIISKTIALTLLGLGLMGNEGCEQPVVDEKPRQPKWYADVGAISSPTVQFGEAGHFDFGYVASEQLYGVLFNSDGFTTSYANRSPIVNGELVGAQSMYMKMFGTTAVSSELYYSDEARCLISQPDVKVKGSVLAFEMSSGSSIELGFNKNTGVTHSGFGLGGKFSVKVKNLSIQMYGLDIAKDLSNNGNNRVIAAPLVNEKSKDTEGAINLSLNQIGLGYSWYNNTPLSVITERALVKAVDKIADKMNNVVWTTKVLDLRPFNDEHNPLGDVGFVIKGGEDVNLKTGDVLQFFEDKTVWSGRPCDSDFYGFTRLNTKPIAEGEVVRLDRNFSTVAITKRFDNRDVQPGWRVELVKKIEDIESEKKAEKKTK